MNSSEGDNVSTSEPETFSPEKGVWKIYDSNGNFIAETDNPDMFSINSNNLNYKNNLNAQPTRGLKN